MYKTQVNTGEFRQADIPMVAFSNALISLSEAIISVIFLCLRRIRIYIKALRAANDRRRTTAALDGLSDHVLKDIGVSRYEVTDFVKKQVR